MSSKLSLEQRIRRYFYMVIAVLITLGIALSLSLKLDWFASISLLLPFIGISAFALIKSYRAITDVVERFGLQLDALANDESNSWHLASYQSGRVAALKQDFAKLSNKIAKNKRHYMQTEEFVFEFASMLDLPIVILDPHGLIYFSNKAFINSISHHQIEGKSASDLGIDLHDGEWQQNSDSLFKQRFQISSQTFWRTGRNFELLTFFSIEQQLRDNEQLVWQRLIRVLNHEVRNSLTPIYSMSQSLQTLKRQGQISSHDDLAQDMLQVIEKRAQHLLDFVASYSAFAKLPPAQKQAISSEQLNTRLSAIFPELVINSSEELHINADFGQLEQALINLIKNAFEAGSNSAPSLTWSRQGDNLNIAISDQGCGIQNLDNLFVPFYSTKANGTGIGLVITRELVRNQGFELSINSKPQQGTEATITVPS